MAHRLTSRLAICCLVSAFLGTLLIVGTCPLLAQAVNFLPVVTYSSGGYQPLLLRVADVNADGRPDLIVANWVQCRTCGEGEVSVLLNNGDGTFRAPMSYDSGAASVSSVAVGDVNADGHLDLIVLNQIDGGNPDDVYSGSLGVLLGKGDGTFQNAVLYNLTAGPFARSVTVGDVNGDGGLDIIVASDHAVTNFYHGVVSVLLNRGNGTFTSPATYTSGGWAPISVAMGDVNGDRKPDLVVANQVNDVPCPLCKSVVGVLLGNGDGTFQNAVSYNSGGGIALSVAIRDLNSDGHLDLVVANGCQSPQDTIGCVGQPGEVGVLLGKGDGTFQSAVTYNSGGAIASSVVVDDLNGDGHPDLAIANPCQNLDPTTGGCSIADGVVGVLLGNGDGTFRTAVTLDSGGPWANSVATGDLNGDGKPDIAVANAYSSNVGVLLNNISVCASRPSVKVAATPMVLWPPNSKLVPVTVSGKITDSSRGCTVKTAVYAVRDEYGRIQPSGAVTLTNAGAYRFTVWLQASRTGTDLDGRHYTITVGASNNAGNTGSQGGTVIVPHDRH